MKDQTLGDLLEKLNYPVYEELEDEEIELVVTSHEYFRGALDAMSLSDSIWDYPEDELDHCKENDIQVVPITLNGTTRYYQLF